MKTRHYTVFAMRMADNILFTEEIETSSVLDRAGMARALAYDQSIPLNNENWAKGAWFLSIIGDTEVFNFSEGELGLIG